MDPACSCLSIICLVSVTIIIWITRTETFLDILNRKKFHRTSLASQGALIIMMRYYYKWSSSHFLKFELSLGYIATCHVRVQDWVLGARPVINWEENDSSMVEWSGLLERWNIAMAIWDDGERTLDCRLEHWIAHLLPYTRLAPRHWIVNTTQLVGMLLPSDSALRLSALCSTLQIQSSHWRAH